MMLVVLVFSTGMISSVLQQDSGKSSFQFLFLGGGNLRAIHVPGLMMRESGQLL
jgi:hypothetical protein